MRELFYNVPARRRFLRAERTELSHVEEWLRTLALARPDVEVRQPQRQSAAENRGEVASETGARLVDALGEDFSRNALRIEHAGAGLRLHGWIAQPSYNRASADQQYLFVSGRGVRKTNVAHTVRQAHSDVLFTAGTRPTMRSANSTRARWT